MVVHVLSHNRTIVELKSVFPFIIGCVEIPHNRTIVELKCVGQKYIPLPGNTHNRTIVELKFANKNAELQATITSQSNHSGIEISRNKFHKKF